jgi:hypothetical protein
MNNKIITFLPANSSFKLMAPSVGIIIPAYRPDIPRLSQYICTIQEQINPEQVIVEIDDPNQETIPQLSDLPAEISQCTYRRGKGAAITMGFEKLDTGVLTFADADGSTPVNELKQIIDPVRSESSDIAIGSRRHPKSDVQSNQTIARRYMGDMYVHLVRSVLDINIYDFQCGAKAVSKNSWTQLRNKLYEPGFAWDLELIAVAQENNYLIDEIPIQWQDKPQSTVDPVRTPIDMIRALLLIQHRIGISQNSIFHQAIANMYADTRSPIIQDTHKI